MKPLFITGIDTGTGKSIAAACLCRTFADLGYDVFPFKPVQSGCVNTDRDLNKNDALLLKTAAMSRESIDEINPYSFSTTASPHFAAKLESTYIDKNHIFKEVEKRRHRQMVIIEGAGGVASPITDSMLNSDLAGYFGAVIIVVTTPKLGTINHTLLTLEHLEIKGLTIVGLIVNSLSSAFTAAQKESIDFISGKSGVRLLGYIPFIDGLDLNKKEALDSLFQSFKKETERTNMAGKIMEALNGG